LIAPNGKTKLTAGVVVTTNSNATLPEQRTHMFKMVTWFFKPDVNATLVLNKDAQALKVAPTPRIILLLV